MLFAPKVGQRFIYTAGLMDVVDPLCYATKGQVVIVSDYVSPGAIVVKSLRGDSLGTCCIDSLQALPLHGTLLMDQDGHTAESKQHLA